MISKAFEVKRPDLRYACTFIPSTDAKRQSSAQLYGYTQVLEQKPLSNLALISEFLETAGTVHIEHRF